MFGKLYYVDMYGCSPEACDDLELVYRFLETLVDKLGMTKMSAPIVIHGPRNKEGVEVYPDKEGISGWVPLIESGIQIHTLKPSGFIALDIFTCGCLDPSMVNEFCKETFKFTHAESALLDRGIDYEK